MSFKSFLYKYKLDSVPFLWKPFFYLYGYFLGLIFFSYFYIIKWTCRFDIHGREEIDFSKNYIFCFWHGYSPHFCPHFIFKEFRHSWIGHPFWYMKPVMVALKLFGVKKFFLGSAGYDGQQAAKNLVQKLKQGDSTVIMPDGPNGPIYIAKKGAVHIASQSGVSLMPVTFKSSPMLRLGGWDNKRFPVPFTKIHVMLGPEIAVTGELEKAHQHLQNALNLT